MEGEGDIGGSGDQEVDISISGSGDQGRLRLLGGRWFIVFAWNVCESVAFDEVHDEIGCGFQGHEKQHCQAHGQAAIATMGQQSSGHDCQMHRNDACVREEHHCSDVGFGRRLPLAIVEKGEDLIGAEDRGHKENGQDLVR